LDQKDLPEEKYGGSIGILSLCIPFIWLQRSASCSKFIDVPLQPVG
jgi:hypothetical protein